MESKPSVATVEHDSMSMGFHKSSLECMLQPLLWTGGYSWERRQICVSCLSEKHVFLQKDGTASRAEFDVAGHLVSEGQAGDVDGTMAPAAAAATVAAAAAAARAASWRHRGRRLRQCTTAPVGFEAHRSHNITITTVRKPFTPIKSCMSRHNEVRQAENSFLHSLYRYNEDIRYVAYRHGTLACAGAHVCGPRKVLT